MEFYLYKDDRNIGPLPENEVSAGLRNGRFLPNDLGCRVGDGDWKDLSFFCPLETAAPLVRVNQPVFHQPQPSVNRETAPLIQRQQFYQSASQPLAVYNQPNYMQQPAANFALGASSYQNGDYQLFPRLIALFIDAIIGIPLAFFAALPVAGIIGAPLFCLYLLSRDALCGGQSVGKRVMGLRVIKSDGQPFTWGDSAKRNIIYLPVLLLIVPWVGHFLHAIVASPLGMVEIILVLATGRRIGDRLGDTYVVRA